VLRSLRSRVIGGMTFLIGLVFAIALLGVNSISSLDESVDRELAVLLESTDLSNGLIASLGSEIRSAEQYLLLRSPDLKQRFTEDGDSAYAYQRRFRTLAALTTSDRYIVNKIAANQAAIEVAYATAHALADLGRADEAHSWETCEPWRWRRTTARSRGRTSFVATRDTGVRSSGSSSWCHSQQASGFPSSPCAWSIGRCAG
jgi:hypothetical protein